MFLSSASLPNQPKPDTAVADSPKPETPTNQNTLSVNSNQSKSQSDSELEMTKKGTEETLTTTEVPEKKDKVTPEPEVYFTSTVDS